MYCQNAVTRHIELSEDQSKKKQQILKLALDIVKGKKDVKIPDECPPPTLWGEAFDQLLETGDEKEILDQVRKVFCSFESLSVSFYPLEQSSHRTRILDHTPFVDYIRLGKLYQELDRISESEEGVYEKLMTESISNVKDKVSSLKSVQNRPLTKAFCRIMLLWLCQEKLYDPSYEEITSQICDLFYELEGTMMWDRKAAENFFVKCDTENFLTCIKVLQQQLTFLMFDQPEAGTEEIEKVRRYFLLIDLFYYSSRHRTQNKISVKEFHNDLLNREWSKDLPDQYIAWWEQRRGLSLDDMQVDGPLHCHQIDKRKEKFLYVCYPWAFDASSKQRMLNYESQISRKREVHNSLDFQSILFGGGLNLYLVVKVSRDSIVEGALNTLVSSGKNLKKPLKVKFEGEPGVDEGGVQKEFFQLLVREIFDVGYGMFDVNQETNLYYFKKDTFESPLKFELIGIILGLAIYNNHILDVHFPLAVYKKLLGRPVNLEDYHQYDPQVAKSLTQIQKYDKDDFKEVMGLTFTVDYDSWGAKVSHELKEGGKNIEVTNENKNEYIDLYVDFMLNKSVESQFNAFKKGFIKCCGGEVLEMLEPEDLEMLICGSKVLDFSELKKSAVYQDGYSEESQTVKNFWEVLLEFNDEEKKKFMFFCTGCDRAPINGLKDLKLFISKHGDDDQQLPSVHTCFNHLLLPDYSSKEVLREKLTKAIHNSEGFGLI